MKKILYIFLFMLFAANLAAQQSYVIDSVCLGADGIYRIDTKLAGSTWEWLLKDTLGNEIAKPTGTDFWVENNPGDTTWGNEIKIIWSDLGAFDLSTLHYSSHGCEIQKHGRIKVFPLPEVYAGKDMIVCVTGGLTLTSDTAANYSSLVWTTRGDGIFDDDSQLNPIYTPGANDKIKGIVTLVITANGLALTGTCLPAVDSLEIRFGNPLVKLNAVDLLCYNDSTGSVKVTVTGGSEPLDFSWTGPGSFTASSDSVFKLAAGIYEVTVTDNIGCVVSSSVEVTQPDELIAAITADKSTICYGDSIKLSTKQTGGTESYTQLWTGIGAAYLSADTIIAPTFRKAPAGLYELICTVTDANGCTAADTLSIIVNPVYNDTTQLTVCENELPYNWRGQMLNIAGLYTDKLSSINGCDSTIHLDFRVSPLPVLVLNDQMVCEPDVVNLTDSLVFAGSSPNLIFTYWLDSLATLPLTNPDKVMNSGRYFILAENGSGCLAMKGINAIIEKLPVLVINTPEAVCEPVTVDLTNPAITTGSDNNLLLTYWFEEEMLTAIAKPGEIGLSGIYYIRAESPKGCIITKPVVITIHIPPSNPKLAVINPTCEITSGTIEVTSPLDADLTYSIDGTIFQPEPIFENLAPGDYSITVKNSVECISSANATIDPLLNVPEIPALVVTQPDCSIPTGTIEVKTPVGADLVYSIDGTKFQAEPKFENMIPGDYTVTVKNIDGCFNSADETITPAANTPEIPVLATLQPDCDISTGTIEVTSPVGADLTFSIDGATFQAETKFENLIPGDYTVIVKNSDGCINSARETINPALDLPENPVLTATQPDCDISTGTIEVTSPVGTDFTYSIDGISFQPEIKFENLTPGDYTISVKNSVGCINLSNETIHPAVNITEIPVLTTTQPDCDFSTGTIEVKSPVGIGLIYSIDGTNFQTETKFENLAAGDYTITVKNIDGCINSVNESIDPAPDVPETPVLTAIQPDCDISTGTIEVTIPVGDGLTYSIDGTNFQPEPKFVNLLPGDYTVTVKNSDGCTNSFNETIDPAADIPEIPVLTTIQPDCEISTGTIEVTSPVGADLTYSIDGINFKTETKFENLAPGDYTFSVTNNNGCTSSIDETIDPPLLKLPVNVTIVASSTEVDDGDSVTFTATPVNEGTAPVYAWFVNDTEVLGINSVIYSYAPQDGDVVYVVLTSDLICTLGNPATSNEITIKVNALLPVSVDIVADQTDICEGGNVTLTATPVNGGANPVYAWFVNGKKIPGATSVTYTYSPQNGDVVYTLLMSSLTNVTGNPATSNEISITIRSDLPVNVSIIANKNIVCDGETVSFTTYSVNGGTNPVYAWYVNGIEIPGETSAIFAYTPKNRDLVFTTLTSNLTCAFGNPATSNKVPIKVNDNATISVTISSDKTDICENEPVTFTALPANGGENPRFAWFVNRVEVQGETSITFTYQPKDKDAIYTIMTSDLMCTTDDRSYSNIQKINVTEATPVSVSVFADKTEICEGEMVTYTVTPVNGGTNPVYTWFVKGVAVPGETSPVFKYPPQSDDEVYVILTSDIECVSSNPATSDKITVIVNEKLPVSVSLSADYTFICDGAPVTFTATPVNEGANPKYEWFVNNVAVSGENSETYKYEPKNGDEVYVMLTSDLSCISSNPASSNKVEITITDELPVSVSIIADKPEICEGEKVTYTATPVNEGTNPLYAWFVNGVAIQGETKAIYIYSPKKGDEVYTVLTSDWGCVSGNPATSNKTGVIVTNKLLVAVSIVADYTEICKGEKVTFTATSVNGGINPDYEWFVNGKAVGGKPGPSHTYTPDDGDEIYVKLTSSETCVIDPVALSDTIKITYTDGLLVKVDIEADKTAICLGETVNFSATPVNGGDNPGYTWYVNGKKVKDEIGDHFAYKPVDKDEIYVKLTSSKFCVVYPDAISDTISIDIADGLQVEVDITADKQTICDSETVTFTATSVNGGDNPVYAWFVNGKEVKGEKGEKFEHKPKNSDKIYVKLTSSGTCVIEPAVLSDSIIITVADNLIVSVSIDLMPVMVCEGVPVTLTAKPKNGGSNPVYKWFVNNLERIGENTATFTYIPKNKDRVYASLESDLICLNQKTDISNVVDISVGDTIPPKAICRPVTLYLDAEGKAGLTIAQINNGSSDNCKLDTMFLSRYNFDCTDVGKNQVTLTAVDAVGLRDWCEVSVTVLDTISPLAKCVAPFSIQLDQNAEYTLTTDQINVGSSDNCGIDTIYIDLTQLNCDHIGLTPITLTVVDVNGNISYCTTNVTIFGNIPPMVLDDEETTFENVPIVIDVVSNDYDEKTSIDISSLSISIKPKFGTVTINPVNGDLTYTPNKNFVGVDVLQYRICDDGIPCEPECGTAFVYINVLSVNEPPITGDDYFSSGCISITENVLDNDRDPDSDNLQVNTDPLTPPIHGTVTIDPDGTINYFPNDGFIGIDSFEYIVCDNGIPAICDTVKVYIKVDCNELNPDPLQCELFIPEGFSPNNDGILDFFRIWCIEHYPDAKLMIFNRNGNLLWEKEHYGNYDVWGDQYNAWWWGTSVLGKYDIGKQMINGEPKLKVGNYVYVLKLGGNVVKNGTVMISY